ncbi:hypothetical protein BCR43DRAFT_495740 [Syncephalastrum racemosum]|uniref:Uncharacterized protein n=1 Tax=Syncephalastrum racemosum TaxID=13706 RepID=A0A1X2H6E8_SYNRA|nr:hypothetical protein BCR43DRAFT_495740 [Syncephalastrum racemosum]
MSTWTSFCVMHLSPFFQTKTICRTSLCRCTLLLLNIQYIYIQLPTFFILLDFFLQLVSSQKVDICS